MQVGSRMDFVAHFLGRRLAYTYEVVELVPGERFVMRTPQGPFPMETTYTWQTVDSGATRMTLRNQGRAERLLQDWRPPHGGIRQARDEEEPAVPQGAVGEAQIGAGRHELTAFLPDIASRAPPDEWAISPAALGEST